MHGMTSPQYDQAYDVDVSRVVLPMTVGHSRLLTWTPYRNVHIRFREWTLPPRVKP